MANSRTLAFDATPRNRAGNIDALACEIEHASGQLVYTASGPRNLNDLVMDAHAGMLLALRPLRDLRSDIKRGPAVRYTAGNLQVALTPKELTRLMMLSLTPSEFFALANKYGIAFEWHCDFYDFYTGAALQPRRKMAKLLGPIAKEKGWTG